MSDPSFDTIANEALSQLFGDHAVGFEDTKAPAPEAVAIEDGGRARGPDGKFVSLAAAAGADSAGEEVPADVGTEPEAEVVDDPVEPEADEASDDTPEEEADAPEDEFVFELDPDHPFFAKFDGDPDKALKALEDAQSFIGRQSSELGELRALREQFEAQMSQVMTMMQGSQIDWDTAVEDDPKRAADMAVQYGNNEALDLALHAMAVENPMAPYMYMQGLQQELERLQAEEAAASQPAPIEAEVHALKAKYPDMEQLLPTIQKMAAERPLLAKALAEGHNRDRAQALEDLYHLAKSRSVETATSSAAKRVVLKAKQEAEAAKAEAAVVGASNTTVTEVPSEDEILQEQLRTLTGLKNFVIT